MLTTSAPGLEHRSDLGGGGLDVPEVGPAVGALGRRHAQEHDVGVGRRGRGADLEPQPSGREALGDDVGQALLDDRDLAAAQPRDAVLVDVGAHDVVAEMGQAGTGGEADVADTDHTGTNATIRGLRESFDALIERQAR